MRRLRTEAWAGIAMVMVSCGVALPALLGYGELRVPHVAWIAMFVVFGTGAVAVIVGGRSVQLLGLAACVVAACGLVLATTPGLLPILLVVTAAMSAYVVPLWCGLLVIALNSAAVALSAALEDDAPLPVVAATSFYLLIQFATLLSTLTLIREQRLRSDLAVANLELRASNVLLAESARAAERLRISRDLHDLLGHQLTALTLQLETARQLNGPAARSHVDAANRIARELLGDVRETVTLLRVQPPDLERALQRIATGVANLRVRVSVGGGVRVDEQASAAFLRATQEVITNAVRHASASEVCIEIVAAEHGTLFLARDDGVGGRHPQLGNGLTGLRERFEELGGVLEVEGSSGFQVLGTVPRR